MGIFWSALTSMWVLDRSAGRGMIACRGLYVFSHDSKLGNAPAHVLFDRVSVRMEDGVVAPRRIQDYHLLVDKSDLPNGVSLTRLV